MTQEHEGMKQWLAGVERRRAKRASSRERLATGFAQQIRERIAEETERLTAAGDRPLPSNEDRPLIAGRIDGLRDALQILIGTRK